MTEYAYNPPDSTTHFLVSGGGKGITAQNAIALAEAFGSRFTLLGRSKILDQEPSWAEGLQEHSALKSAAARYFQDSGQKISPREISREVNRVLSSREIKQTLEGIRQAGGKAAYIAADITKPDDLSSKLQNILPDVNALLHGAGALADKMIQDKTGADFDLVYGVKVGGLMNILAILPSEQLDFIILFSSVAGFYGNAGQADYSLSNEVLNKLAYHLKHNQPDCQVLSLNWGPWDGGMVTPQLKRILTRKNVDLITPEKGTRALVNLLVNPQENPQYVVGTPLPFPPPAHNLELQSYRISRNLTVEDNPFLSDHVIGGNAVLPTVCAVAWFVNACTALYPGFHFHTLDDYRVFKGIVFDDQAAADYRLDLIEIEKTKHRIVFEGKISSRDRSGKQRFHYQAKIAITDHLIERPVLEKYDLARVDSFPGQDLYDQKTLFHGPCFQGVERILNLSPQGLTTECWIPETCAAQMGQFPIRSFNPLLADAHLQSLLIWAHLQLGSVGLPLQIKGAVQYQKPPLNEISYATMRVITTTPHKLVADVISHDSQGTVYTEVREAEITLNQKLYELFQSNSLEKELV